MTQAYIGTKIVGAWTEEKDGKAGYAVEYDDGYRSWCPKSTFEKHYRCVSDGERDLVTRFQTTPIAGVHHGQEKST